MPSASGNARVKKAKSSWCLASAEMAVARRWASFATHLRLIEIYMTLRSTREIYMALAAGALSKGLSEETKPGVLIKGGVVSIAPHVTSNSQSTNVL